MRGYFFQNAVLLLCVISAVGMVRLRAAAASDAPPPRTSLADPKLRFAVPDKPYVLADGVIELTFECVPRCDTFRNG